MFDPSWFDGGSDIADRLRWQLKHKGGVRRAAATKAYLRFLAGGGRIRYRVMRPELIAGYLRRGIPVLTGLSATYLYGCARETEKDYDNLRGVPQGHFVVLSGWDARRRTVEVADPLQDNPLHGRCQYTVGMDRVIGAILLGIVTYDANLVTLQQRGEEGTA
jgi:hypothetical protein